MKAGIFALSIIPCLTAVSARPHPPLRHGHNVKPTLTSTTVTLGGTEVVAYVNRAGSTISIETVTPTPTSTDAFTSPPFVEETPVSALPVEKSATILPVPGGSMTAPPVPKASALPIDDIATIQPVEARSPGKLLPITTPPKGNKRSASDEDAKLPPFVFPVNKRSADTEATSSLRLEKRDGTNFGICYAPYTNEGQCKSAEQIADDFSRLQDYGIIRTYGTDCEQIPKLIDAAKSHGKKLFVGLFDIHNLDGELQTLIDGARDSWDVIAAVSVGNEQVNSGQSSAEQVVQAINHARDVLRGEGYQGPVATVDTTNAIIDHPELCEASDFCGLNSNAFFDPNTASSDAGEFVRYQAKMVADAAAGKRVVVTESGWPHWGSSNGKAVASPDDQWAALESLKKAFEGTDGELYLFSAFDDPWKEDNEYTFGAEKFWGFN